jgi:hypothetical protein
MNTTTIEAPVTEGKISRDDAQEVVDGKLSELQN